MCNLGNTKVLFYICRKIKITQMKYVNETVRRQDRLMDEAKALKLLENGEYGVLSMVSDGGGYGIPVNYVWDGKNSVYIHCAPEGRKLEALKDNNKVSLCIIGEVNLLPNKFTTEYESALFFGTAQYSTQRRREDESPAPAHQQAFCRLQGHRRQIRQQELPPCGNHTYRLHRIQRKAEESASGCTINPYMR